MDNKKWDVLGDTVELQCALKNNETTCERTHKNQVQN